MTATYDEAYLDAHRARPVPLTPAVMDRPERAAGRIDGLREAARVIGALHAEGHALTMPEIADMLRVRAAAKGG